MPMYSGYPSGCQPTWPASFVLVHTAGTSV